MVNLLINTYSALIAAGCVGILAVLFHIAGAGAARLIKTPTDTGLERFLLFQAMGAGIIAYSIFGIGLLGGIRLQVFIPVYLVIPALFFRGAFKDKFRDITRCFNPVVLARKAFTGKPLLFKMAAALFITFAAVNLINALTPPVARDAMRYHLMMPKTYVASGFIRPDPLNFFSYFPQLTEMLYTFGMLFSNDLAARLIHFYFGLLTALTVFMFARRLAGEKAAVFCALLFYSTPVASSLSGWAYADLSLSFFSLLAVGFFIRVISETKKEYVIVSAVMMAFALSVKYTACISVYAIIVMFLIRYLRIAPKERVSLAGKMGLFLAITAIAASPWYLRNLLVTGNPLYPMFYSIFGGPGWDMKRAVMYDILLRSYGMGHSMGDLIRLPWNLTVYASPGTLFDGRIGAGYLAFTPFLLWLKPAERFTKYMLIYCACFFLVWARLSQQTRFLLPALAGVSVTLYPLFSYGTGKRAFVKRLLAAACLIIAAVNLFFPVEQAVKSRALAFVSGRISREEYITGNLRNYKAIKYMNENLPDNSRTAMVYIGNVGYYCEKNIFQESVFEDYSFKQAIVSSEAPGDILKWFRKEGITHLLIDEALADKYIYPDIGADKLGNYNIFRGKHLCLIHRDGTVCLYEVRGDPSNGK